MVEFVTFIGQHAIGGFAFGMVGLFVYEVKNDWWAMVTKNGK